MGSPNRACPESMVGQFYDADAATTTLTAWAPKSGQSFARGFLVVTSGNLFVDLAGTADTTPGKTNVEIPASALVAGQIYQIAIAAIRATSVGVVIPLY